MVPQSLLSTGLRPPPNLRKEQAIELTPQGWDLSQETLPPSLQGSLPESPPKDMCAERPEKWFCTGLRGIGRYLAFPF